MGLIFESLYVINQGVKTQIDGGSPFAFLGHDGLGMPNINRFSQQGAQQHGHSDNGYRLKAREFSLLFQIESADAIEMWNYRTELLGYFAPYQNPIVEFNLLNGEQRRIDCHIVGDMRMGDKDQRRFYQRLAIMLQGPEPSFYDPTAEVLNFNLGGGADAFDVPTPVPTEVGASTIDQTSTINYAGTWLSYPTIRITGPITDAVVTNLATDEKLDFDGITIAAGDYYDIDTRYGYKTVVAKNGTNKIADLTSDSDLATFHIQPASAEAPNGDNSIRVEGSSIDANTEVIVTYFVRYLGI